MSTSYLDLNGLGYLWGKANDKFASKNISSTDIEAVGISRVENEGNPVVISDVPYEQEAEDVIVEFEPIQDLHGYDHPWPAGGGKNLLKVTAQSQTINGVTFTVNEDKTVVCNGTATAQTIFVLGNFQGITDTSYALNGAPNGSEFSKFFLSATIAADYGSGVTFVDNGASHSVRIIVQDSQAVSNLVFKPMIRLASETDATFEPYSNVCPISGRTGVEVVRCGKNLLNMADVLDDAWISTARTNISSIEGANVFYADVPKNTTIKFSSGAGNRCIIAGFENRPSTIIGATYDTLFKDGTGQVLDYTFNTGGCEFIALYLNRDQANKPTWIQLELGSTPTPYEPYQAESYDITFPSEAGTVYGGTLDVKTGVLVVDRAIVDLGTLDWNIEQSSGRIYSTSLAGIAIGKNSSEIANMICSIYKTTSNNDTYTHNGNKIVSMGATGNLYVYDSAYNDATVFKSDMSGVQLCYELATPITYQLTPHQLTLLKKYNVITSDASNIRITYDGKSDSTIQSELDELNETIFMIKQSISNSQIDNMFDALDE